AEAMELGHAAAVCQCMPPWRQLLAVAVEHLATLLPQSIFRVHLLLDLGQPLPDPLALLRQAVELLLDLGSLEAPGGDALLQGLLFIVQPGVLLAQLLMIGRQFRMHPCQALPYRCLLGPALAPPLLGLLRLTQTAAGSVEARGLLSVLGH